MNRFLSRLVFNTADAGGGGAPAAAASPDPAAPPAGSPAPSPSPSAGAPAAGADPSPAAGSFYRPEGLPEHLVGKDGNETMDKLYGALKGYRERDAQAGVPEKAEAYGQFSGEIPETIRPHLETLKGDPLFSRVADKALALKVPVPAYQGLVQEFLSVSAEMGLMEPIVNVETERAALLPDTAKHLTAAEQKMAIEKRMNDNFAYLDAMVERGADKGGLSKDDAEFAKAMLGDSAKGHRFFEFVRAATGGGTGGGPAMGLNAPAGNDERAEISRLAALPEHTWGDPKFDQKSYDALVARRQKLNPT